MKIGTFQPLLTNVLPVADLAPALVLHPTQMSETAKTIEAKRLLDLGGAGDCFFLAVNAAMSVLTRAAGPALSFNSSDIYRLLKVPEYTYIEDDHIAQFAGLYPFALIVVREYEGECHFCQFGDSASAVFLFNDFPRHYMLFDQVIYRGQLMSYNDVPVLEISEGTDDKPEEVESFPDVLPTKSSLADDPGTCVIEDLDLRYLYQFVDTRYKIRKAGKKLGPGDSKAYYKLRHNLFKTVFLNLLGLASTAEKPMSDYGIDSARTPDLVLTSGTKMLIIEFTVVKRFITSLKTKQSQSKYSPELAMLEELGWSVVQMYPTLSLDEGVSALSLEVSEAATFLSKEVFEDVESVFIALQSELTSLEYNISELIPELLLNQEEFQGINLNLEKRCAAPDPFPVLLQKVGMKRQRDQNTFLLIRKNSRNLERQLKLTRYNAKFIIIINKTYNKIYVDVDSGGVQKNTLLSLLQNNSTECVKYVQYVGKNSDTEEPFQAYGSPDIDVSPDRKQSETKIVDTGDFERYYRNKLVKGEQARSMPTLVDNVLKDQVPQVRNSYLNKLAELRAHERKVIHNKRWFVFPVLTDLTSGTYKPIQLQTGLPLTDRLIRTCRPVPHVKLVDRNQDLTGLDENIKKVNDKYLLLLEFLGQSRVFARKLKNIYNEANAREALTSLGFDADVGYKILSAYQGAKKDMVVKVGEPTRTTYKNRVSLSPNYLKTNWPAEMEHFNQPKGKIRMCEDVPLADLDNKVQQLLAALWQLELIPTTDDVMSDTEPLGIGLKGILNEMKTVADDVIEPLRRTRIMHDLQFISRLAYTVLYYSNIKSNKEDFFFDNLGYTNAVVLIKGGKKILSNKKSRLFKIIFPIKEGFTWAHATPHSQIVVQDGQTYCVWPWQTWSFPMLKKAAELYFSFPNYFACSYLESGLDLIDYQKFISTKVLNMYSQRRKVEIWFGFFRYLYLNSMSSHTNVLDLIDDMVDFEYDPYFSYCQKKFAESYRAIYDNASVTKIYDMVSGLVVENFDLCAEKFDESIFMTMAPFDRVNEHLRNLRSVLTLHKEVTQKYSSDPITMLTETSVDIAQDDYFEQLGSDDLKFDPKLTYAVGVFAGEMLSKVTTLTDMSSEFNKIISKTYTEISTSKGMRDSKGHFWGKKGHDVVLGSDEMQKTVLDFLKNFPQSHREYKKTLSDAQVSYKDRIESLSEVQMEFDLKDKAQWKGSREIYVMSETTKLLQSPLEKFFKYLCTWTPNELIHKKSHVRPKFIHSQVFEFETGEDVNTYATLDCRKWAPKSNLWKYYYFVKGMSPSLPEEFVDYFEVVWSLMFSKKVRIQSAYVELLRKNPATLSLIENLHERPDGDFEFTMNYSFMMGIFNYLSSLLHAFSQLYFDAKIARGFGASFNLIAHSDDSGGVIFSKTQETNLRLFRMYEMFQKGLNHLMSKKKCSLSDKFFEMISIMYANKRLIPMTHKFLANVSFEPKGKGWVDDISTIVSKIVEIFSNGGSMLQCYITMLTMSEMIRKFYHLPRLKSLSTIPLSYGGLFNLHPIHMILLGADAQEVLLDCTETPGERGFRVKVGETLFGEYFPGKGVSANYHIPYYKTHNLTSLIPSDKLDLLRLVSGVIPDTTLGQASGHFSRLKDPAYVYSLSGVDMCQIYTMTLFTRTIILNAGATKKCDLRRLTSKYAVMKSLGLFAKRTVKGYSNFQHYAKASEGIKLSLKDMSIASKKTCKPLIYSTFQNVGLGLSFKTVNEIIAYRKAPELHFMFPDKNKMEVLVDWVKANLQYTDEYILEDYLMKLSSKDLEKTRSSYCFIPSGVSVDTIERFWTYINFYCTRRYYISSQKPQYFTIDQFKLWNADYESLKHMYLLVKVALRCPLEKSIFDRLRENARCSGCGQTQTILNMVDEIFDLRNSPNSSYLVTDLPFAVYTQPQHRAINVWYGRAEFILYTKYGTVEVSKKLGQTYHIYSVISDEFLDQVHFLLQNFLTTRGLPELDVAYTINDTSAYRLGFSDLRQPRVIYPGERAMQQTNSVVYITSVRKPKLYKDGEKLTLDGLTADFEIYQNYDINETFYNTHSLENIKNLIFDEEKIVDTLEIRRTALATKTYEVLQVDASHSAMGNIETKYQPGYLLGSERSLTRALVMADKEGKTSYRSTSSPAVLDAGVLEGLSHKDIPVVDLVDNFSFSRITYKERKVIESIVTKNSIEANQEHILNGIIKKLGMKPTMNALTMTRVTFSDLVYRDVRHLAPEVCSDYLITMVKSSLMSLEDKFDGEIQYYAQGNMSQIYQQIALAIQIESSPASLGELLTKVFMRAQKTSPGKLWEYRKDNIYAALIVPRKDTFKNQCLFNQAILVKAGQNVFGKLRDVRQIHLALRQVKRNFQRIEKKIKSRRKEGTEYLIGKLRTEDLERRSYILNEDDEDFEDEIDCLIGGDDPENGLDRDWDEDEESYEGYIFNDLDYRCIGEDTLISKFSEVTIKSVVLFPPYPWLGPCDCEMIAENGVPMYVTTYPGRVVNLPTINSLKEAHIPRNTPKPLTIEEAEPIKAWAGQTKVKTDIFELKNEEDVYTYQFDVLKQLGITNPDAYSSNFFKLKEVSNEEYFWSHLFTGVNLRAQLQIDTVHNVSRRRTPVLPGFTGNLKDDELRAELNALFMGHAEEIVSGNQCLTRSSYKTILRSFRRLYRENLDDNVRAYIIIFLSTMRDCVISTVSDGWYSDSLLEAIDSLEETMQNRADDDQPPPLPVSSLLRNYRTKSPYE
jgi:hypothetical protein